MPLGQVRMKAVVAWMKPNKTMEALTTISLRFIALNSIASPTRARIDLTSGPSRSRSRPVFIRWLIINIAYDAVTIEFRSRWTSAEPLPLAQIERGLFYNGTLILDRYAFKHILDRFFVESIDISYDAVAAELRSRWMSTEALPLAQIERGLTQSGYDLLPTQRLQLSLYSVEERVFAYWYLAQVLGQHLIFLDNIKLRLARDSQVLQELEFQTMLLTALQFISIAVYSVIIKQLTFSWQRMRLNFLRRYKWAFLPDYDNIDLPPVGHPNFLRFVSSCAAIPQDEYHSPCGYVHLATDILSHLATSPPGLAGKWSGDCVQPIISPINACDGYASDYGGSVSVRCFYAQAGSRDSQVLQELEFQTMLLTALQFISIAVYSVIIKQLTFSWQRMRLNFLRRYKWAFLPDYDNIDLPPVGHPNFLRFVSSCAAIPQVTPSVNTSLEFCSRSEQDEYHSPCGYIQLARDILSHLATSPPGLAGRWSGDRVQFIISPITACDGSTTMPSTMEEVAAFDDP
ncbi:hypothetical protein BJ138DRAFT_1106218 [Hygrophoropsis aurantiaca]|uniref:Uncharacterized protein n=1 Tax=Hygrophoropsis aurantiaca TaxID=72124 RepID=A0ACB7ZVT6_9AGAM|nr:hypothetical protein BJ138DRAFT_1106218 [Hygrophoropsis aurantiaca]